MQTPLTSQQANAKAYGAAAISNSTLREALRAQAGTNRAIADSGRFTPDAIDACNLEAANMHLMQALSLMGDTSADAELEALGY